MKNADTEKFPFYLELQIFAVDITPIQAIEMLQEKADELGICLAASINGRRAMCHPGDTAAKAIKLWQSGIYGK